MPLSSQNPTALEPGMNGLWNGRAAEVAGRAVLKNTSGYRWDEYYLKIEGHIRMILVYEAGGWKRFEYFTPSAPFSAAAANDCRTDQWVSIGSERVQVLYISESRVVYAEGETLDGVRDGSRASYFNGETGHGLFVASWTGDEIEFFTGEKLTRHEVPQAFNLAEPSLFQRVLAAGSGGVHDWLETNFRVVIWAVLLIIFFGWQIAQNQDYGPAPTYVDPAPVIHAPLLHFATDAKGTLEGRSYTITRFWREEIDEVGKRSERYEYALRDENGDRALLIGGLSSNPNEWYLFRPEPQPPLWTPLQAGEVRVGAKYFLPDQDIVVKTLFLSRTLDTFGTDAESFPDGAERYGFLADGTKGRVMVRWTANSIEVADGRPETSLAVNRAFGPNQDYH